MDCKVTTLSTFLGPLTIVETARGVRYVDWDDGARQFLRQVRGELVCVPGEPDSAREFIDYFSGRLRQFSAPADLVGTPFQKRCWQAMREHTTYGQVITYGDEARLVGTTGYQAVGQANRRNPVAILIPCHRVVAQDGPGGYFGSRLDIKRALLALEGWPWPEAWDATAPKSAKNKDADALTRRAGK